MSQTPHHTAPHAGSPADDDAASRAATHAATHAMALLRAGVPLSLLCDLALPVEAREVFAAEPADVRWAQARTA